MSPRSSTQDVGVKDMPSSRLFLTRLRTFVVDHTDPSAIVYTDEAFLSAYAPTP